MIIMRLRMNFIFLSLGGIWLATSVMGNSEAEKWSWPTSPKDREQQVAVASNRKDIYYENIRNDADRRERIRVPTSYDNSYQRPSTQLQQYQVKESTTNRPKPLSDEFSNEFLGNGENYGSGNNVNGIYNNNNRFPPSNFPNRFGPPQQQHTNDFSGFPQFGYQGAGPYSQFGGYPHQHYPGGPSQFPGQYPNHIGNPIGYPQQTNSIANGILVGPNGPTGIFGRPHHFNPYQNNPAVGGGGGIYGNYPPQFGFASSQPGHFGFEGQHNALGPYNGIGGGGFPHQHQQQFGGGPGSGFYGPQFDSTSKNSAVKNKIEKSAK